MTEPLALRADVATLYQETERAARIRRAIRFALSSPAVGAIEWPCLYCSFVARGATEIALQAAMDAHGRYVNAHADPATDPHFEDVRMDALLNT